MNLPIKIDDLNESSGEPRVLDIRLAEALGFDKPRNIRDLIQRNENELAAYSEVYRTARQTSEQGGRPGTEYWLTEEQALLICMRSDAPRAPAVRAEIIAVFMAWRRGKTPAISHQAIDAVIDRQLEPIRADIAELKSIAARTEGNVTYLSNTLMPRRNFTATTRKIWLAVVREFYAGHCPCGCGHKVLDRIGNWVDDASDDHFFNRSRNKTSEGWPILSKCNQRLCDPKERRAAEGAFAFFQQHCARVAERILHRKAIRTASKTTRSPNQSSFPF